MVYVMSILYLTNFFLEKSIQKWVKDEYIKLIKTIENVHTY